MGDLGRVTELGLAFHLTDHLDGGRRLGQRVQSGQQVLVAFLFDRGREQLLVHRLKRVHKQVGPAQRQAHSAVGVHPAGRTDRPQVYVDRQIPGLFDQVREVEQGMCLSGPPASIEDLVVCGVQHRRERPGRDVGRRERVAISALGPPRDPHQCLVEMPLPSGCASAAHLPVA
ncbi:hypothetical protein JOF56_008445 [Kibdelosporangium banguiense]|uniref:Uncharacterized protein n=1 Tax=Kibdelosporangium banguiense TaxID=1365924 RepID=A0ABS4TUJ2_9PSEU|nr:hypothetical protein [Kibdelosporangium banguiense]MBP2328060.1 hypothetical protein [Kibdelosporangium banguiense]